MLCLCDRGADYEAQTITGMRSLHYAAMNGHISIVKSSLKYGMQTSKRVMIEGGQH
jgi:ankyrin repeat protein